MRVLVTLPWEKHIEFLRERSTRKQIAEIGPRRGERHTRDILRSLVIWLATRSRARWRAGSASRRVIEFVEELIRIGRAIDPNALFSYATYPPTEYLLPQNVDFFCFNVYLHNQRDFERYLLRLQNLTERASAYPGRIRHGHHPPFAGRTGRNARLARR